MIKPTSNANVLYQVGNDYAQAPASAYFKIDSYHDGIYTKLNQDVNKIPSGEKPFSQDGFDDTFFNMKDPAGLNKRTLDVLPQSAWDKPEESAISGEAYFSDDYATAVVTEGV